MSMNTDYRPLQGSERRPIPGALRVADENPSERLSVTIRVRRRADGPLAMPVAGAGPTPHLTREEFAQRFGASDADLKQVADFAKSHGLRVEEQSVAKRVVVVSGSVEQMNEAFGVKLGRYEAPTETYRGREGPVQLPPEITPIVEGVFGLDNRRMARRVGTEVKPYDETYTSTRLRKLPAVAPKSGILGGPALAVSPLTPPQVASLYNFPTTPDATGQTIGLIEFGGGFIQSDLQSFIGGLGAPVPTPVVVGVDGVTNDPGVDSNEDMEVTLDIDVAASVARNANIALYFAPWTEQGWVDVITTAVHDAVNNPSTLSISWGWPEFQTALGFTWTQTAINAVNATFQDAAALGVSVFVASGDAGSDSNIGDGSAHVLYPGSDPFITSCGGTRVSDVSGSSFNETTWANSFGTTGGGISDLFPLPVYQNGASIPGSANDGHTGRGIPDIAGNADPASGYNLIVGGSNNGSTGGTSATAPLYAALAALCNARLGRSIGFLNPLLYALQGTGVLRDIADGASNATSGAPGYTAGAGWDGCTGLGVVDGSALLGALQARFTKDCTLITDRSSFSKDEVDALLSLANPGVIDAAFYVTVDGFTPAELGITTPNPTPAQLVGIAPAFTIAPGVSGMSIQCSALRPELPALPAQPQRFTFVYQVSFTDSTGFTAEVLPVQLTAATHGFSSNGLIELVRQPNPYMLDGQVSWLSTDVRVFQLKPGDVLAGSGVSVAGGNPADASQFIKDVIGNFNAAAPTNHPFDLISTDQNTSRLELSEQVGGTPVFNFAVARVRYRALAIDATQVRVFFRAFQASTTGMTYDPATTYRSGGQAGVKIPLLGVNAGEVVTIPFFAELRVNSNTTSMNEQTDPANVQTISHGTGEEHDGYFGCWLDINQATPQFPITPGGDGPFGSGRVSIQQLVRNQHQCLVAEIAFDAQPIFPGVNPASSDKLSQRNLAIIESDNPGSAASHRIPNTFDIKPTREQLPPGWTPDEIMIDWGNTPAGSEASIYLPGAQADEILEMAAKLYGMTTLHRIDAHTLGVQAGGATWIPVPPGSGANYAGLLTIDLPATVKRGQSFTIVMRQVTSSARKQAPPPPPPIGAKGKGNRIQPQPSSKIDNRTESRHTLGAFQITIPVSSKERLLEREERMLSVLRWIQLAIPSKNRWEPVFRRYVDVIGDRVGAFGGDPGHIKPSPDGSGVHDEPKPHPKPKPGGEQRVGFVGKVDSLIFDRFGEFDGFMLDTEDGQRRFHCRTPEFERVLTRAWSGRVRVKVVVELDKEDRPESIILYPPPLEWMH